MIIGLVETTEMHMERAMIQGVCLVHCGQSHIHPGSQYGRLIYSGHPRQGFLGLNNSEAGRHLLRAHRDGEGHLGAAGLQLHGSDL